MSWWDYGYQITAMANRTILVDNNTWNNTHISRVGQAMASSEEKSYEIMKELDVDYVLVIFGGLTGYSSDGKNESLFFFFNLRVILKEMLEFYFHRSQQVLMDGTDSRKYRKRKINH